MKWTDTMSIGIPGIDEQHRTVFDCINRLEAAGTRAGRALAVRLAMEELDGYVEEHFGAEELLMRLFHYPGLDDHVREHREFARQLTVLRRNSHAPDMHIQAAKFLRAWWANHIMVVDRKYSQFIHARPADAPRPPKAGGRR